MRFNYQSTRGRYFIYFYFYLCNDSIDIPISTVISYSQRPEKAAAIFSLGRKDRSDDPSHLERTLQSKSE